MTPIVDGASQAMKKDQGRSFPHVDDGVAAAIEPDVS